MGWLVALIARIVARFSPQYSEYGDDDSKGES